MLFNYELSIYDSLHTTLELNQLHIRHTEDHYYVLSLFSSI
jgi:hypothetical protein